MKTLTVKQPWASLIVEGIKDIENRTWRCPQKYIGKRVLIHAGMKPDNIKLEIEGQASVKEIQMLTALGRAEDDNLFGCIIGSVEIVDCVEYHKSIWAEKSIDIYDQFSLDRHEAIYNWVLANPIKFDKPIPCKGRLSFWESEIEACYICGKPTTKHYECVICNEFYCDDCAARYNKFTQIDYNCCSSCAESHE